MKEAPLVSVIITTYNREKYLHESILSVSNQTYENIEILVIDDGCNINYAESICNNFSNCNYYYKENGGLSSARNYGVDLANGEYIAFLDDDDFWESSKIEKQVKILLENPSIDCVHSSVAVVDENGKFIGKYYGAAENKIKKRSGYVFWNALGVWVVKSPTPLIRKKVFQSDLVFDESIKVGEDIDFYQRMFYRHKVYYINEPLAFYREYDHPDRLSLQQKKYLGIEKKMYHNFKRMKIKNPFILYYIKVRLLKSHINRNNMIFENNPINVSDMGVWLRTNYFIKKYF
ncbi:glycosyltransferase family 2 protein [Flavobacterium sharifuzzamanii]|uniref:glycosyltransferase family 2 protein n=1 Tax=Flavobacterium sharifuzzamanii TaxID=2211133 RepID=UPI0013005C37|nr:glycosyltransferase [Flavobacterium sharifuzzamanii]KAF2081179.1 glycosyltransferase [Flavobacterium sharifuzzamanii]